MKKIIIFGAGQNGRNLLKIFRFNQIEYFCDNDKNKIGKSIYGIPIISFEYMKEISKDYDIILSVISEEMKDQLLQNDLAFYNIDSLSTEYFMREDVKQYIDEQIYEKYLYDTEFEFNFFDNNIDNWFREEYCSQKNEEIVKLMKKGNDKEIYEYLDALYIKEPFFGDEYFNNRPGMRLIRNILKTGNYVPYNTHVLELGCGHGELLLQLMQEGFCVKGVEKNSNRVTYVNSKGIDCINANIENVPCEDNSFDVVICQECLEHVINPIKVVKEMKRLLRGSGRVYCNVPYGKYSEDDMHVRQFDERKLYSLFKVNGFDVIKIIRMPYCNSSNDNNLFIEARLDDKER